MLLKDFLKEGVKRLEPLYPAQEARSILDLLCESRLGTSRLTHILEPEFAVKEKLMPKLTEDIDALASGKPIQYVLGYSEFFGRRFAVSQDVLIPRPETELLCEEAIKTASRLQRARQAYGDADPVRILDLCTGSGCIAWTMALEVPGADVIGVDISEKALSVALGQDFKAEIRQKKAKAPSFMIADALGEPLSFGFLKFDIILSNPPYIMASQKKDMRRNVLEHEPHLALFVPDDDPVLFYRAIARWSKALLSEKGVGIVEINEDLGPQTRQVFLDSGFDNAALLKDFSGKHRFISY